MEVDPYRPPSATLGEPPPDGGGVDLRRLVPSYRRLVRWAGVQLLLLFGGAIAIQAVGPAAEYVRLPALLVTAIALLLYAYRTASALGSTVPAVWAAAMVVPLVNLMTLLILSSRATRACRAAGVPVGFLGPKEVPGNGPAGN